MKLTYHSYYLSLFPTIDMYHSELCHHGKEKNGEKKKKKETCHPVRLQNRQCKYTNGICPHLAVAVVMSATNVHVSLSTEQM